MELLVAGPVFKEIADKLYAMNVDRNSDCMRLCHEAR